LIAFAPKIIAVAVVPFPPLDHQPELVRLVGVVQAGRQ
jgi:hypothetical protein